MSSLAAVIRTEEFNAPGPGDFNLPGILDSAVTKPMVLVVLSGVIAFVLFYAMSRKAAVVPGRLQFAGEYVYGFVRNAIARDTIGGHDYARFVPFLFAIFLFVLINNFYGVVPFIQFPTMSHIGYTTALALITWVVYNGVGIKKHGFGGYLKHVSVPPGITGPILLLLVPLEFMSNVLVRPVTLALRLFANMFAGHLLLILFALGGQYILTEMSIAYAPVGIISWVLFVAVAFLEILIQFLQAYVFVLLNAMYISGAVSDDH